MFAKISCALAMPHYFYTQRTWQSSQISWFWLAVSLLVLKIATLVTFELVGQNSGKGAV